MQLSDRSGGSQRGGGYRRNEGEGCSILLAGGEDVSAEEWLSVQKAKEMNFFYKDVQMIDVNRNEEEILVYRTDQTITLGSREVGTSSSRQSTVEAFIDSVAESLNQHESELPDSQREKIVQILDPQLRDTCDAHLENTLGFDFEEMDSDTEERVNDPNDSS